MVLFSEVTAQARIPELPTLTLNTSGPSMIHSGKTACYQEVLQLKGENDKTFTTYIEDEDGQWMKLVVAEYTRKKK